MVDFAQKVGISRVTVRNVESGKSKPQQATLKMWALATGVNYEWLLTGKTPPPGQGDGVAEGAPSRIRTDDLFFKSRQSRRPASPVAA